jgi:hypothetical protein
MPEMLDYNKKLLFDVLDENDIIRAFNFSYNITYEKYIKIVDLMYEECQTSYAQIIESVYRKPNANRYLASFVPFMARHRDRAEIRRCIDLAFDNFIERNLLQYPDVEKLPINFVGSIAAVFEQELTEALSRHSLTLGKIERSPIGGMVKYHTTL